MEQLDQKTISALYASMLLVALGKYGTDVIWFQYQSNEIVLVLCATFGLKKFASLHNECKPLSSE